MQNDEMIRRLEVYKKYKPFKGHLHKLYAKDLQDWIKGKVNKIIELGSMEGSMQYWLELYPEAQQLIAIDNGDYSNAYKKNPKILFHRTHIYQPSCFEWVNEHGPYDIIIDDAVHERQPQRSLAEAIFSSLSPHGVYLMEDVLHQDNKYDEVEEFMGKIQVEAYKRLIPTEAGYSSLIVMKKEPF